MLNKIRRSVGISNVKGLYRVMQTETFGRFRSHGRYIKSR